MEILKVQCRDCGKAIDVPIDDFAANCQPAIEIIKQTTICDVCLNIATEKDKDWKIDNVVVPDRIKESRLPVDFFKNGFSRDRLPEKSLYDFVFENQWNNIVLSDMTGIAKTGTLIHFGLQRCQHHEVFFTTSAGLMEEWDNLKTDFSRQWNMARLKNKVNTVQLLILDDVGKEPKNSKYASRLLEIADVRYRNHLTTWVTMNMGKEAFDKQYGKDSSGPLIRRFVGHYGALWNKEVLKKMKLENNAEVA